MWSSVVRLDYNLYSQIVFFVFYITISITISQSLIFSDLILSKRLL